jgi:hypothetical protein
MAFTTSRDWKRRTCRCIITAAAVFLPSGSYSRQRYPYARYARWMNVTSRHTPRYVRPDA